MPLHVIGPYDRFPLSRSRSCTPTEAPLREYQRVTGVLRMDRSVIVQPSGYGTYISFMLVRKRVSVRSERLVWGSNWPHPIQYGPMPDDGDLLDALAEWISDRGFLQQVLVDNTTQLYGFAG